MTEKKQNLSRLEETKSPQKVSLGYDYQYPIKGIGKSSYKAFPYVRKVVTGLLDLNIEHEGAYKGHA